MARTKSRFNAIKPVEKTEEKQSRTGYRVGMYARLSVVREGDSGESVDNQIELMKNFIKGRPEFTDYRIYTDKDYSGTNFKRPGFEEMMDDIRAGKINCVIVKDLSRFGRDYLETSNFIETIFPFMGVRFISVNDHFDTCERYNANKELEIALKNLVNDMYAKDISKRVSSVRESEIANGRFVGGNAPYGYKVKDDDPLRRFVIDPGPAEVVMKIYDMALQEMPLREISKKLQEENYTIPRQYAATGHLYQEEGDQVKIWHVGTISNILRNRTYTGELIQGKRRKRLCEGKDLELVNEDEWVVIKDAHEPIISEAVYDSVRNIMEAKVEESSFSSECNLPVKPNKYAGLIFCGICGKPMSYSSEIRGKFKKKRHYYFFCSNDYDINKPDKCNVRITEDWLDAIIADRLRELLAENNRSDKSVKDICKERMDRLTVQYEANRSKADRKLNNTIEKAALCYESYVLGDISKEQFKLFKDANEQEEKKRREELRVLASDYAEATAYMNETIRAMSNLKKAVEKEGLDRNLANELLKRVDVYPGHEVEIRYRFKKLK